MLSKQRTTSVADNAYRKIAPVPLSGASLPIVARVLFGVSPRLIDAD